VLAIASDDIDDARTYDDSDIMNMKSILRMELDNCYLFAFMPKRVFKYIAVDPIHLSFD